MSRQLLPNRGPYWRPPTVIQDSQDLSELSFSSGAGSFELVQGGGPSPDYPNFLRLTHGGGGAGYRIKRDYAAPPDFTQGCVTWFFRFPNLGDTALTDFIVTFLFPAPSPASGNYQFNVNTDGGYTVAREGLWIPFCHSVRAANASGVPDYPPQATVGRIDFGPRPIGDGNGIVCDFGPVFTNVRQRTKVMLTFDGCDLSIYDHVFPNMQNRGFAGTLYVIDNQIGTGGNMTLAQIEELRVAGWTVAPALGQEQSNFTDSELADEVKRVRAFAAAQGWNGRHISWHGNPARRAAVDLVYNDEGLLTGRLREVHTPTWDPSVNLNNPFLPADDIDETASNLLAGVDSAIEAGYCRVLWGLGTAPAAGGDKMAEAEFVTLLGELESRKRRGLCDVVSMEGYEAATRGLRRFA